MAIFSDQLGHIVSLPHAPDRIVSLVPSQTELLHYLGLQEEVVGITKFCIHPDEWFREKERVGGTKNVNIEKIKALQPDLILANKEENEEAQIRELESFFPIWVSDICGYDDALKMIKAVGLMVNKEDRANELVAAIETGFQKLASENFQKVNVSYLIWKDPYMTIGRQTFINDMLQKGGFANVFQDFLRYPQIDIEQLKEKKPDAVFLSTEPYPFSQKHADELQRQLTHTKVILVDGELFSWYGSRMLQMPKYLTSLRQQLSL